VSATTPAPKRRPVADGVFLCAARTSRTAQSSLAGATEPHGFSIFGTPPALSTLAVHQLLNVLLNCLFGDKKNRLISEADTART
jgi:hypothetical protein